MSSDKFQNSHILTEKTENVSSSHQIKKRYRPPAISEAFDMIETTKYFWDGGLNGSTSVNDPARGNQLER